MNNLWCRLFGHKWAWCNRDVVFGMADKICVRCRKIEEWWPIAQYTYLFDEGYIDE